PGPGPAGPPGGAGARPRLATGGTGRSKAAAPRLALEVPAPTGRCVAPDHRTLYVCSTGKGPGDTGPGGKGEIYAFDVGTGAALSNKRLFSDCVVDGVKCGPDGLRADVDGNLWVSSNAGRAVGYNGVTVWTPRGKLIGRIRLPEVCGNLTFGGPKRHRLVMADDGSTACREIVHRDRGPTGGADA
ncbi:SMP-30/gluconolactonase/LRE family protein, partial [Methylobacterium radiotolerans]|uniref:SMP-30/gluconolactonase/LRE family protein n=1 Tax=Methylobacterium radiotolerans TaxID=31998 RepID=UPI001FDA0664